MQSQVPSEPIPTQREASAALVLCGGSSRRMGSDKTVLPFGDETLLERVARIVADVVSEVWLVAREGQLLEVRSADGGCVPIARDPAEGLGPLAGIVAGLRAMRAEQAFVTACDCPLLKPAYMRWMLALGRDHSAVVPRIDGHLMTMSAVYSRALLPAAERLLEAGELRPRVLFEQPGVRIVGADELRDIDPELHSLYDCDTPDAYREALRIASEGGLLR